MKALIVRFCALVLPALVALAQSANAALPEIKTWETGAGTRVLFVAAPEIPMVDIRVTFQAGAARDGAQPGIAQLTSMLLNEGAGERDAEAFNEALALTGAQFGAAALKDMAWVEMRSLTDPAYLKPALALFADVLAAPRFDAQAVAREKQSLGVSIQRSAQDPGSIATERFYQALYGDHPYASPQLGTADSVAALDAAAIRAFFERFYVLENAVIAVVGDLTEAEARQMIEDLTARMLHGEAAAPLPAVVPLAEGAVIEVPYDSLQTHVRSGQPGLRRGDPDYFPLLVGNHVLGGNSMVSQLFKEVREKRGLSYSVYSVFEPMAELGPFRAALQTGSAQREEALAVLDQTIREFVSNGPSEADLEAARQNLIGGFPLRVNTNSNVLEYLAVIGAYDLPLDYLDTFRERVAAVSADDVREAFARRIDPDLFVTVVVGRVEKPDEAPAGES